MLTKITDKFWIDLSKVSYAYTINFDCLYYTFNNEKYLLDGIEEVSLFLKALNDYYGKVEDLK